MDLGSSRNFPSQLSLTNRLITTIDHKSAHRANDHSLSGHSEIFGLREARPDQTAHNPTTSRHALRSVYVDIRRTASLPQHSDRLCVT
jgi:hypothetical protein